jgi:hypothetical protein
MWMHVQDPFAIAKEWCDYYAACRGFSQFNGDDQYWWLGTGNYTTGKNTRPALGYTTYLKAGGKGVGEECVGVGFDRFGPSEDCQAGLTCYKPPPPPAQGVKACVQMCATDDDCAWSGQVCGCVVETDCYDTGCVRFCRNPNAGKWDDPWHGDSCFWPEPQVVWSPTTITPAPAPAPGPSRQGCFGFPYVDNICGNPAYGCYPDQGCERRSMPGCGAGGSPEVCRFCAKPGGLNTAGYEECPTEPVKPSLSLGATTVVEEAANINTFLSRRALQNDEQDDTAHLQIREPVSASDPTVGEVVEL